MTLAPMTRDEAARITERIRVALDRVSQSWADLGERITEAYQRRADLALGYSSWSAYAEAELKPSTGLAADVRRQLVGMLAAQGMSTRAIAPTVGVSNYTVHADQRAGVSTPNTSTEKECIDPLTGEVVLDSDREPSFANPAPTPAPTVTGLDGKSYPKPAEPSTPRRRPLTDGFRDAALDLFKITGRFERLVADDRFTRNKNEVARYANDLTHARDALQRVIEQLS